ncbi:MAG: MBL fold metallo-hydrolase [Lachnospiraceae bacterium]|nr:MBL fold metallo-hydrolase [Lachnospiraceae bacterium]
MRGFFISVSGFSIAYFYLKEIHKFSFFYEGFCGKIKDDEQSAECDDEYGAACVGKGEIMQVRVLIENEPIEHYKNEHGLSLYIAHNDKKYLLDTGSSEKYVRNAALMSIRMSEIDMAFLSHGHYDHSGGFGKFVRENSTAPIYAMEGALGKFGSASGEGFHEIGVPEAVKDAIKNRVTYINQVTEVAEGVTLVPHSTAGLEAIGERGKLYREKDGEWMWDDFAHEMSVVFETDGELVVFNSCSHAGLKNIVEEVKAALPGKKIGAYIGGLHMRGIQGGVEISTYTQEEIKELADYIKAEGIEYLYTGHCTGQPAYEMLKEELGETILWKLRMDRAIIINEKADGENDENL